MRVHELMTTELLTVPPYTSVRAVAAEMRDANVGCVLVTDDGVLCGLVTDRDLAVRVLAEGGMAGQATVREVVSGAPVTVSSEASVCDAAELMRVHALRRLPVVDAGRVVGILSLGDIAQTAHAQEVLVALSRAEANH